MTATESARILVVDDDPLTRLMASEALREGGFVTLEAQDGAQALGMFDAAVPDLVLLEVVMPGRSGVEGSEHDVVGSFPGAAERAELHCEAVRRGGVVRGEHVVAGFPGHERLDREFDSERHDTPP